VVQRFDLKETPMAVTAVSIAANLPWKQIISALPEVVGAARALMKRWESKPKAPVADPAESLESRIQSISSRVQSLEDNERAQSEVVSQLAEQLQGIAAGLKESTTQHARFRKLCVAAIALAGISFLSSLGVVFALINR
jgi:hypothetical protein